MSEQEATKTDDLGDDPEPGLAAAEDAASVEEAVAAAPRRRKREDPGKEVPPESIAAPIEALLLATGDPLSVGDLAALLEVSRGSVQTSLELLVARHAGDDFGIQPVEIAGGWQFGTKPQHAELIEEMLREVRRIRLSPASLETLAIIAYRQPVTRAEIETIRGVNIDGVMKTLLDRELIKITGKKEEVGRPLLYGTTDHFLMQFGLRSIKDLPPLSEFDEIARAKADEARGEEGPDWYAVTESQREALDELASAAEKELSDLDAKLRLLKPPKVVLPEDEKPEEPVGAAVAGGGEEGKPGNA